jgi:hypothetical protein
MYRDYAANVSVFMPDIINGLLDLVASESMFRLHPEFVIENVRTSFSRSCVSLFDAIGTFPAPATAKKIP